MPTSLKGEIVCFMNLELALTHLSFRISFVTQTVVATQQPSTTTIVEKASTNTVFETIPASTVTEQAPAETIVQTVTESCAGGVSAFPYTLWNVR